MQTTIKALTRAYVYANCLSVKSVIQGCYSVRIKSKDNIGRVLKMETNGTNDDKRPQYGSRYLTDESKVYQHNAWDDVEWDQQYIQLTDDKITQNSRNKLSDESRQIYEKHSSLHWNQFYDKHENKFFKDRNWLFAEFPDLKVDQNQQNRKTCILEVGCGVGNTIFPIIHINANSNIFVYGCDFSSNAVSLVKQNNLYDESKCNAFTLDITENEWKNVPFEQQSIDIITLIFVLSSIEPLRMQCVINNATKYLKPGGILLFRDYGRYDMTQVRFKDGHCIEDNFYVRGDGTRAYFFTEHDVDSLLTKCGLKQVSLRTDKRLQINRAKQLKMYRVYVQAKYIK